MCICGLRDESLWVLWDEGLIGLDLDKVFTLLRAFPQDEPTRKKFVGESVAWSAEMGEFEYGDPELHHVAGTVYAEGVYCLDETVCKLICLV